MEHRWENDELGTTGFGECLFRFDCKKIVDFFLIKLNFVKTKGLLLDWITSVASFGRRFPTDAIGHNSTCWRCTFANGQHLYIPIVYSIVFEQSDFAPQTIASYQKQKLWIRLKCVRQIDETKNHVHIHNLPKKEWNNFFRINLIKSIHKQQQSVAEHRVTARMHVNCTQQNKAHI